MAFHSVVCLSKWLLLLGLLIVPAFATEAKFRHKTHGAKCTAANTSVRKEWGSLTKHQRRAYIDAVLCLQSKKSIIPAGLVPGALSRADDFTATHINQTLGIHLNGVFLSWHRNFVWLYEKALREECGYRGTQPYWNWSLWCTDLAGSPLFDGSATSLSGDGVFDNSTGDYIVGGGATLPHGTGGGCVKAGPFKVSYASFDLCFIP